MAKQIDDTTFHGEVLQSDVPDYLNGLRRRDGISPRWPHVIMELTSRRRSDEIPRAIEQLQLQHGRPGCADICLASAKDSAMPCRYKHACCKSLEPRYKPIETMRQ